MGITTDIEWCDSTVNATSGCEGCELWNKSANPPVLQCYAGPIHEGRLAKSFPTMYAPDFTDVRLIPGRMEKAARWSDLTGKDRPAKPWLNGLPRHIFVGDMGDLFSKQVPCEYIFDEVWGAACPPPGNRHVYMILTKQAMGLDRMRQFLWPALIWPNNIWAGVSITKQPTVRRGVIAATIHKAEAMPRFFLSVEPVLEAIDLRPVFDISLPSLVIVGGESGSSARPCDLRWLRSLRDQCRDACVPFFLKQLGSSPQTGMQLNALISGDAPEVVRVRDRKGGDPAEWPIDLRVREFPATPSAVEHP